ncbi:MAG TPA: exodeoxyribonuclease VII large subunit [Chthoniobacterales bacterium]
MTPIYSVSQIARRVRALLEENVGRVWVEGEISNHRRQSSGHQYFTLKDERAQLNCVMFARAYGAQAAEKLADGLCVQAYGQLTVYETRGQYQLLVELVQAKGLGALQARFEALKQKLQAAGLFDQARKRPLPAFPRRVALITSPTGAAIQDMLNVLQRRSPWLRILICPVRVQGEGACDDIADAVRYVSEHADQLDVQVMIVGRGGGSLEDLWSFNEEPVAHAIHLARIPVISAVGHEIDFTIADFVADLRAPTPSAAAELVAPELSALTNHLQRLRSGLERGMRQGVEVRRLHLGRHAGSIFLREPLRILQERQQRLDQLEERLQALRRECLEKGGQRVRQAHTLLQAFRPGHGIELRHRELERFTERLQRAVTLALVAARQRLMAADRSLGLLGPQQTLERGYSITRDRFGHVLSRLQEVPPDGRLRTQLSDGELFSQVEDQPGAEGPKPA